MGEVFEDSCSGVKDHDDAFGRVGLDVEALPQPSRSGGNDLGSPGCEALSLGHPHLGFCTTHQHESVVTFVLCIDNFAELLRHDLAVRLNSPDQ